MKLTSLLMQGAQANEGASTSKANVTQKTGGEKFDSFLAKADNNTRGKTAIAQQDHSVKARPQSKKPRTDENADNKTSDANSKNKAEETPKAPVENSKPTESSKPEATTEITDGENEAQKAVDKANQELIAKLSEILGISAEAMAQMLSQLNMQPVELTNPENLMTFMKEVYGVESNVSLLSVPDIQNVLKETNGALAEFTETAVKFADTIAAVKQQEPAAAAVVTAKAATTTAVEAEDDAEREMKPIVDVTKEAAPETPQAKETVVKPQTQQNSQNPDMKDEQGGEQQMMNPTFNPAMNVSTVTQAETEALKAVAAKPIDTQDVINQIVENLKVDVKPGVTEIKISLRPEHLGDVSLKITTQNGIVTAQFVAENQRIKEVLEAGFNQLREQLEQQGISVSQLQVSVGNENQNEQMNSYNRERQNSSARMNGILSGMEGEMQEEELSLQTDRYGARLGAANVDYKA